MIVYEYPFNERIRTLLRLEDLCEKFTFFLHQEHPYQHHGALATIFEMLEVAGRADLKSELLQEMERQKQTLLGFKAHPNVEVEQLDLIVNEIDRITAALLAVVGLFAVPADLSLLSCPLTAHASVSSGKRSFGSVSHREK